MPKLYYFAHSCGVACFIAFHAAGVTFQTEQVEIGFITNTDGTQTKAHVLAGGGDFYAVNPKGNVPCLVLDDGTILNENAAILDFVIDHTQKCMVLPFACHFDVERGMVLLFTSQLIFHVNC